MKSDDESEQRDRFHWDLEGTEITFVENMQAMRERRNWSQTHFAKVLREKHGLPFHQPTIQRIEAGERPLRMHEAFSIARALGVPFQAMHEDVSLTWAYDNMLDQMQWKELSWGLSRATDTAKSIELRIEEIEDSLGDYRGAADRFSEELNTVAIDYAERLIVLLREAAAIFRSRDEELGSKVAQIQQLVEDEGEKLPRDYHGGREWLKDWKEPED
jgi:transcriptional regulator with XRE-family HTH domain